MSDQDFRSILQLNGMASLSGKTVTSASALSGHKYVAYVLDDEDFKYFDFPSDRVRLTQEFQTKFTEQISFRDGHFCAGATCNTLIRWSDSEFLEFDAANGQLKAWWIADR
jgi:hypothetical protein